MKAAWILSFFIFCTTVNAHAAAPSCGRGKVEELRSVCLSSVAQNCADIPAEKRFECQDGLSNLPGVLLHCAKGVFGSLVDFGKFIYELGKLYIDSEIALLHAELHPINSVNSVARWSRSQYMSVSQTAAYVNREIHVAQLKHQHEWFSGVRADIDVIEHVAGPVMNSAFGAIEDGVASKVHEFSCYKRSLRSEMLCKVIGDFFVPPAAVFKLIKYGAKAFETFPSLARGLERITNMVKSDARLAKTELKFVPKPDKAASPSIHIRENAPDPHTTKSKALNEDAEAEKAARVKRTGNFAKLKQAGFTLADEHSYVDSGEVRLVGSKEHQLDLFRKDHGAESGQSKLNRVAYNIQDKHPVRIFLVDDFDVSGRATGLNDGFKRPIYDLSSGKIVGSRFDRRGVEIRLNGDYVLKHPDAAYSTLLHETVHAKTLTSSAEQDRRMWFSFGGEVPEKVRGYKSMQADEVEARVKQLPAIEERDPYRASLRRKEALDYAETQEASLKGMQRFLSPTNENDLAAFKYNWGEKNDPKLRITERDAWYSFKFTNEAKGTSVAVKLVVDSTQPVKEQLVSQVKKRLAYLEHTKLELQKPVELKPFQAKVTPSSVFVSQIEKQLNAKIVVTPEETKLGFKSEKDTFGKVSGNQIRISQRFFNERGSDPDRFRSWINLLSDPKLDPARLSKNILLKTETGYAGNLEGRINKMTKLKAESKFDDASKLQKSLERDVQSQLTALKSVTAANIDAATYELETLRKAIVRVPLDNKESLDFIIPKDKDYNAEIHRQISERLQAIEALKEKLK